MYKHIIFLLICLSIISSCSPNLSSPGIQAVHYTPTPGPTPIPEIIDLQSRLSDMCRLSWQYQYWTLACYSKDGILVQIPGTISQDGILTFILENTGIHIPVNGITADPNGIILFESDAGDMYAFDPGYGSKIIPHYEIPGQSILSTDDLSTLGLIGEGFELRTTYAGTSVRIVVVITESITQQIKGQHGLMLNPILMDDEIPSDKRLTRLVLMGHYRGYLSDTGSTPETYPFEEYLQDLARGRERNHYLIGRDAQTGEPIFIKTDPTMTIEIVFTQADPESDSSIFLMVSEQLQIGYAITETGNLRLICYLTKSVSDEITLQASIQLVNALWAFGWTDRVQQGDGSDHPLIGSEAGYDSLFDEMMDLACRRDPVLGICSAEGANLFEVRLYP